MMCVSATSDNLNASLDPGFGRCAFFIIVDPTSMQFTAIPNTGHSIVGGAGIQAAQTIANSGAKTVITGNVGPTAFRALSIVGIDIITSVSGTVRAVVEKFKNDEYKKTDVPTVSGHSSTGGNY